MFNYISLLYEIYMLINIIKCQIILFGNYWQPYLGVIQALRIKLGRQKCLAALEACAIKKIHVIATYSNTSYTLYDSFNIT